MGYFHLLWQRGEPHNKTLQEHQRTGSIQNLGKVLACKIKGDESKYNRSGIYQLPCPDCEKKYTGQTGRSFRERYKEHFRFITTLSQTQPLHNTSETSDTLSALQEQLWPLRTMPRMEDS